MASVITVNLENSSFVSHVDFMAREEQELN